VIALLALTGCQLAFPLRGDDVGDDDDTMPADALIPLDSPIDEAGLVAHFTMDDGASETLEDSAGDHHATCMTASCPKPTIGVVGGAVLFNGGNQLLTIAKSDTLRLQTFTVAFWMSPVLGGSLQCPLTRRFGEGTASSFEICIDASKIPFVKVMLDPNGAIESTVTSSASILSNTFIHVAVTWNGTTMQLIIDGVSTVDANLSPPGVRYDDHPLIIGASPPFEGTLDDLRIYNVALGIEDIRVLAMQR
jgi:hypothetical protein